MNKTELTLAIAEELHRLFPDEYGEPYIFQTWKHRYVRVDCKIFELDEKPAGNYYKDLVHI